MKIPSAILEAPVAKLYCVQLLRYKTSSFQSEAHSPYTHLHTWQVLPFCIHSSWFIVRVCCKRSGDDILVSKAKVEAAYVAPVFGLPGRLCMPVWFSVGTAGELIWGPLDLLNLVCLILLLHRLERLSDSPFDELYACSRIWTHIMRSYPPFTLILWFWSHVVPL